jgi:hypothetical protein
MEEVRGGKRLANRDRELGPAGIVDDPKAEDKLSNTFSSS